MSIIKVNKLTKVYSVAQKESGFVGTLKSFFHRRHKQIKAVDEVTFKIDEGELVGFIGPNGAGKTTTLKMLSGLLYPTSGRIEVLDYTPWQRKPGFQKQFAFVAGQKNQLWWDLPAYETFLLNKEIYEVSDKDFNKRIDYLSQMLDISDLLKTQVKKLSLGQRMKAELIAALIHQPKVLFLDEPTLGLDPQTRFNIWEYIFKLRESHEMTIFMTTHYMNEAEYCDRIAIIDHGKIIALDTPANLKKRVGCDIIILTSEQRESLKKELKEKYKQDVIEDNGTLKIEVEEGEKFLPRLFNELQSPISSIELRKPTLEDVFLQLTGHQIRAERASEKDLMRARMKMRH